MGKIISLSVTLGLGAAAVCIFASPVAASPNWCTPMTPWPGSSDQICTGYGTSCFVGPYCSPVPNTPGTYNPNGYTPVGTIARCDSIYCPLR